MLNKVLRLVIPLLFSVLHTSSMAAHASHKESPPSRKAMSGLGIGAAVDEQDALWLLVPGKGQTLDLLKRTGKSGKLDQVSSLPLEGDAISLSSESPPKLAFGPNGRAAISYTKLLPRKYTGHIKVALSTDAGASFSKPQFAHTDRQEIAHRFDSIAFDGSGKLHVAWLDKRDANAAQAEGAHYSGSAIYTATSSSDFAGLEPEKKVADNSCECCRIGVATNHAGKVAFLWRHVFAGNVRDHAFASTANPGAIVRATNDNWQIEACPHHGPALAPAGPSGYHAVWFTQRDGAGTVMYGRLSEDGVPMGEVKVLPDESAEHAVVASAGNRVAVLWRSFDGKQSLLRLWVSKDGGATFRARTIARHSGDSDFPRLAAGKEKIYAVWRTDRSLFAEEVK